MFNPFKRKTKEPEKDPQKITLEPKREEQRKIPKKPWGKVERLSIGIILLLTFLASIISLTWEDGIWSSVKNVLLGAMSSEKVITIEK